LQAGDAGSNPARSTHWECCRMVGNWSRKPGGALRRGSIPPLPATERWRRGRSHLGANQETEEVRGFESRPFLSRRDGRAAEALDCNSSQPGSTPGLVSKRGWSWVGSASARQVEVHGFDPRHPLSRTCGRMVRRAPSKRSHAGSIPVTCSVLMRVMPSEASRLITCGHSQGAHPWPATNDPPGRRGPTRNEDAGSTPAHGTNPMVAQR
jgi:hypothetical protein